MQRKEQYLNLINNNNNDNSNNDNDNNNNNNNNNNINVAQPWVIVNEIHTNKYSLC